MSSSPGASVNSRYIRSCLGARSTLSWFASKRGGGGWLRKWLASRCHLARDTVDGRDPPVDSGPATGGDTAFSDMAAAYDGLDDEMKERLDGLQAAHDYTSAFGSFVDDSKKAEMREQYPVVHHPIVRTHPETGRKLLS